MPADSSSCASPFTMALAVWASACAGMAQAATAADEPLEVIEAPALHAAVPAHAPVDPVPACQSEVAHAIRSQRALADSRSVQFTSVLQVAPRSHQEAPGVKGAGLYRGPQGRQTPFSYGCAFSARSGAVTGVLFRDPQVAEAAAAAQARWEPDLTHLSPQDCASAVATSLQDKYPRIGDIRLNAEAWRLAPGPVAGRTLLQGEGGVQRAAGMNAVPFSYSCDVDTRSGKVLAVKTSV